MVLLILAPLEIENILLLMEYSSEGEWEGQIVFLPLR
jgi:hypothetical protein